MHFFLRERKMEIQIFFKELKKIIKINKWGYQIQEWTLGKKTK